MRRHKLLLGGMLSVLALTMTVTPQAAGSSTQAFAGEEAEPLEDVSLELASQQLATDWSVDITIARLRMSRQDSLVDFVGLTGQELGPQSWGGAWIDQANGGKLVIQGPDKGVVDTIVKSAPPAIAPIIVARFSARTISQLDVLSRDAKEYGLAQDLPLISARIDIPSNSVVVKLDAGRDIDPAALDRFLQHYAGTVRTELGYPATKRACLANYMICNSPLRGGIDIFTTEVDDLECSVGFIVESRDDGIPYILTAGHCLTTAYNWRSAYSTSVTHSIGIRHRSDYPYSTTADYGLVRINTGLWGVSRTVLVTGSSSYGTPGTVRDEGYPVDMTPASYQMVPNGYLCKSGAATKTTCGISSGLSDGEGSFGQFRATSCGGDSGGAVYISNKAYGILVAGEDNGTQDSDMFYWYVTENACNFNVPSAPTVNSYYQGLNAALSATNTCLVRTGSC